MSPAEWLADATARSRTDDRDRPSLLAGERNPGVRHRIALPEPSRCYEQDAEWFVLDTGEGWREMRFHDYGDIYAVPGLYEQLFYDVLRCDSPNVMCELLRGALAGAGIEPGELRVLDLGAGNGIMGEELAKLGVAFVVGTDILPQAASAAARDRPGVYRDYHVLDMTALSTTEYQILTDYRFNALTCVAALGFGDIPTPCLRAAVNLVDDGGWVAITIKENFLTDADSCGFAALLDSASGPGALRTCASLVYPHRLATTGTPLNYTGLIARKRYDL